MTDQVAARLRVWASATMDGGLDGEEVAADLVVLLGRIQQLEAAFQELRALTWALTVGEPEDVRKSARRQYFEIVSKFSEALGSQDSENTP